MMMRLFFIIFTISILPLQVFAISSSNPSVKQHHEKQIITKEEEELRLMLQVFLYKNDLPHAYRVAKKGYAKFPASYFWNDKLAQISRWTGNSIEAIKHMMFLYKHKPSAKLRDEIIQYGLNFYKYEDIKDLIVEKTIENQTKKNIDTLVYIFYQIGEPEKAAEILLNLYHKDSRKQSYLTRVLHIYLDTGNLDAATKVVSLIEQHHAYSLDNVSMVSYFYYLKRNIKQAYDVLFTVQGKKENANLQYNSLLSDFGWYMQDFASSNKASLILIRLKKGRLADFERVVQFNQKGDPLLSAQIAKQGYIKFRIPYLFYIYANNLIALNRYDELKLDLNKIAALNPNLYHQVNYWLIRAKVYLHDGHTTLMTFALNQALKIDPNSEKNKLASLYFMTDYRLNHDLRNFLKRMDEERQNQETLYLPIASAYLYLQNIDKASYYAQKLIRVDSPVIHSIEFKFLQAYIFQIQNKINAFKSEMRSIVHQLDASNLRQQKQSDQYWNSYLHAAIYVLQADLFEKKLANAKKYLSSQHFKEISYSWAVRHQALEKSHQIFNSMIRPALWLQLSNTMIMNHHTNTENLLESYQKNLPREEASVASENDGQISLSQDLAYESLQKNHYGQNAYIHHLDLSKKRSNLLEVQTIVQEMTPLVQEGIQIDHSFYLGEGWHLLNSLELLQNHTTNSDTLINIPKSSSQFDIGLKKEFDQRASLESCIGFRNVMKHYYTYELLGHYRAHSRVSFDLGLYKNEVASESNILLLGASKDSIAIGVNWQVLNSTQIGIRSEYNLYHSQDGVDLGNGEYGRIFINRRFREGYPDISVEFFSDFGTYHESQGAHGLIQMLQATSDRILPEDFYNVGLVMKYGYINSRIYTRAWRPFFETGIYYNSTNRGIGYGFEAGYGGKAWNQDHLAIGINYQNAVNGSNETTMKLFVKYQFLYAHP